jgi:hypothetical protein
VGHRNFTELSKPKSIASPVLTYWNGCIVITLATVGGISFSRGFLLGTHNFQMLRGFDDAEDRDSFFAPLASDEFVSGS